MGGRYGMTIRTPTRSEVGAFLRSQILARLRASGVEPPGVPQYLNGAIAGDSFEESPHGDPNCTPGDPLGPETNTAFRTNNVGRNASNYDYLIAWSTSQNQPFFNDYGRKHTSEANYGPPVTPGNSCIARAPGFLKSSVVFDNPWQGLAQGTLQTPSAPGTYFIRGSASSTGPYGVGSSGYFVGSLPDGPEQPLPATFNVPVASLGTGVNVIGYVQNAAPIAPWYGLGLDSGPTIDLRQQFDAQGRVWFEYIKNGNVVTPGEQSVYRIVAANYSTTDFGSSSGDRAEAQVIVNWT